MTFSAHWHADKGCELTLRQDRAYSLSPSRSALRLRRGGLPQAGVGAICSRAIFQMLTGVAAAPEQWLRLHMWVVIGSTLRHQALDLGVHRQGEF